VYFGPFVLVPAQTRNTVVFFPPPTPGTIVCHPSPIFCLMLAIFSCNHTLYTIHRFLRSVIEAVEHIEPMALTTMDYHQRARIFFIFSFFPASHVSALLTRTTGFNTHHVFASLRLFFKIIK
jgi:hypothetical protein